MTTKPSPLNWYFPLRRPPAGVTLGNGLQGVLIWGENTLLLTVARASFWDHRGGHDILPTTNFNAVRHALEIKDDAALAALFPRRAPGTPFPQQMGGAFEGYHAMLVTTSGFDGTKRFSLPISVSPSSVAPTQNSAGAAMPVSNSPRSTLRSTTFKPSHRCSASPPIRERIRVEHGFVLNGHLRCGRAESVTLHSLRDTELRLAHSLGPDWTLDGVDHHESVLVLSARSGQTFHLCRKPMGRRGNHEFCRRDKV